jgi:hypothetical protein
MTKDSRKAEMASRKVERPMKLAKLLLIKLIPVLDIL